MKRIKAVLILIVFPVFMAAESVIEAIKGHIPPPEELPGKKKKA